MPVTAPAPAILPAPAAIVQPYNVPQPLSRAPAARERPQTAMAGAGNISECSLSLPLYDKETSNHRNFAKQKEWDKKIATWLKKYPTQ